MLTPIQLQSFFEKHEIPLEITKNLSSGDVADIFADATNIGYSFASFILAGVLSADRNGIQTNFTSYDELYEAYAAFMVGLMGAQS